MGSIDFTKLNKKLFSLLSCYLNFNSDGIKKEMVLEMMHNFNMDEHSSVELLVASIIGLDVLDNIEDKQLFNNYFKSMLKRLDANVYRADPYYTNIKFTSFKKGNIEFKYESYEPYELFVYDDILKFDDGRLIPLIGYFNEEFCYPTVLENGQNWMSVTPNEVETMKKDISDAYGNVLTFGLGLGYFAYMVARKEEVKSVTVVELNKSVIDLFNEHILPQMECKDKIKVICGDAYEFAKANYKKNEYDYIYVDIWHDVGDGIDMYKKFKEYEKLNPQAEYRYWIEKSILCYL